MLYVQITSVNIPNLCRDVSVCVWLCVCVCGCMYEVDGRRRERYTVCTLEGERTIECLWFVCEGERECRT